MVLGTNTDHFYVLLTWVAYITDKETVYTAVRVEIIKYNLSNLSLWSTNVPSHFLTEDICEQLSKTKWNYTYQSGSKTHDSTQLISKSSIRYNPEPVQSTPIFTIHLPTKHHYIITLSVSAGRFLRDLQTKFYRHSLLIGLLGN
jgi:hypothetical protein